MEISSAVAACLVALGVLPLGAQDLRIEGHAVLPGGLVNVPVLVSNVAGLASASFTINYDPQSRRWKASPTAGSTYDLTITAVDRYQNTVTSVTGDHVFTFAGLAVADDGAYPTITDKTGALVRLGIPTTITFTNGVSAATKLTARLLAHKAQTATLTGSDVTSGKTTSDTGGNGASLTITKVNPVARVYNATRRPDATLTILKSKLLGIATDINHDLLSESGVDATSVGGASVSTNATQVIYTPNDAGDGDTFGCTVSDGNGGTGTGTITVQVALLLPEGISVSGGAATVRILGSSEVSYDIQRSTNLST